MDTLLIEGCTSYVQAMSALQAFREQIWSRCRRVVLQRLQEYGAALGLALSSEKFRDCSYPREKEWDGTYSTLGTEIAAMEARLSLLHTVQFELLESGVWSTSVVSSVWTRTRSDLGQISERLIPEAKSLHLATYSNDSSEIGIYREILSNQMPSFDTALDDLYQQWIQLWRNMGGLNL
jgi:hypothetical protein